MYVTHTKSNSVETDNARSREVSKSLSDRSEIWKTHRQRCCRCAFKILGRWDTFELYTAASRCSESWVAFQYPIRRLIVTSHKASKLRDLHLELCDRSENRQCFRSACQISKQYDDLNYHSRIRGFMRSYDKTSYRILKRAPGPWFNIKMSSYQYMKSHCRDKTISRPSYLHNGISYTGKTTSLYWIEPW